MCGIIQAVIICLAVIGLAQELPLRPLQNLDIPAGGLNNLLHARALDVSLIRLISREALPPEWRAGVNQGNKSPRLPTNLPPRPNSAPLRAAQASHSTHRDGLHGISSAPEGFPLIVSGSPETSRHATPTKSRNEGSPETKVGGIAPGVKQKETRQPMQESSIASPQSQPQRASRNLAKGKGKAGAGAQAGSTRASIRDEGIEPSRSRSGTINDKLHDRVAYDSGTRSSGHAAGRHSSKVETASTSALSAQSQARMIEHHQWLTETKNSIRVAEANAAQTSKNRRHARNLRTSEIIEATAKTNKFRTNSREARTTAKEALSKADQLLHVELASSPKAQECLSNTGHKVKAACAAGAMHAKAERDAAKTAANAKWWNLTIDHTKASAKALTRARAFEEQNNAFQAQYQAKANDERLEALPMDDPRRKKAEQAAQLSRGAYQDKAAFYKSVHDQYRQTRKDLGGSGSEDEERIFPGVP